MAEIQIYDMATNATPNDDDFFEQDIVDLDLPAGRNNKKISLGAVSNFVAKTHAYTSDLQTTNKTIVGAINEVLNEGTSVSVTNVLPATETTKRVATITVDDVAKDVNADDADKILRQAFGEHTVTGNPVTFDAFLGLEVASECAVTMNPIQDLHGYDSPWVGGAGKNKFKNTATSGTKSGITYTINADGTVTTNGTATAYDEYVINEDFTLPSGSYILNGCPSGSGNTRRMLLRKAGSTTNIAIDTGSGASFDLEETTALNLRITVSNNITLSNYVFKPMIRLATETDGTFAPYENICPISGRDSVTVTRTGKNLFDKTNINPENNYLLSTGAITTPGSGTWRISKQISVMGGQKYTLSGMNISASNPSLCWYDKSDNYISGVAYSGNSTITVTAPNNAEYARISVMYDKLDDAQLELGETATVYEPFKGIETHTHTYASTVYGAVDDFVSGEGSNEWGYIASYNGETLPGEWISDRDVYAPNTSPTTGAEVVYKLATPTTITNTPEDITLLKGVNVVSTDGDSLELKYSADIKAYIDSKLNA